MTRNIQSNRRFILIVAILFTMNTGLLAAADKNANARNKLNATLNAHGGIENWQRYRTFAYTMDGFPLSPQVAKTSRSTVDLRHRTNRIEAEGYTTAWDGKVAWSTPGPDAIGLPPRFYNLGSFYFIAMPFVFADPGVVLTDGGRGDFNGKTYDVIHVGYQHGIGHSSKDDYTLFVDPDTHRLALFHHSVTETGVERVTWTLDEYQKINGLLIPAKMTFYSGFNPDNPGDGATFTITKVQLDESAPDPSIYEQPQGTAIDQTPAKH